MSKIETRTVVKGLLYFVNSLLIRGNWKGPIHSRGRHRLSLTTLCSRATDVDILCRGTVVIQLLV